MLKKLASKKFGPENVGLEKILTPKELAKKVDLEKIWLRILNQRLWPKEVGPETWPRKKLTENIDPKILIKRNWP